MDRLPKPLRALVVLTGVVALIGVYVAYKAYHQAHTPIGVLVIDERR